MLPWDTHQRANIEIVILFTCFRFLPFWSVLRKGGNHRFIKEISRKVDKAVLKILVGEGTEKWTHAK